VLRLHQPQVYGSATQDDIEQLCSEIAEELGLAISDPSHPRMREQIGRM
jgi:3-dehydroquinate dehydratase